MGVAVSGLVWMGPGIGSIDTAVERLMASTERDAIVVTYSLTAGARTFFGCLKECLSRGVRVALIVNRLIEQDAFALEMLTALTREFRNLHAYDFTDPTGGELHAKLIIADRRQAIVGSANLSWSGMVANHELAMVVTDQADVQWVAEAVDRLFRSGALRRFQSDASTTRRLAP